MFPRWLLALAVFSLTGSVYAETANIIDRPAVASNLKLLEAWLQSEIDYRDQPGFVVGIVLDQDLIYAKGFGYADIEKKRPMTTDTLFRIGSQSKTFTAIAVLQLLEQGKLSLDDPVKEHLPNFSVAGDEVASEEITIFHLLTHTAGLLSEGTQTTHWSDCEFPTWAHIDEQLKSVTIVFPPETKRKYSNLGYVLAGRIVEAVSGESFGDYVTRHILTPLGMDSTFVEFPESCRERLATGYGRRMPEGTREVIPHWDAKGMTAACGMSSTVTDMAKYVAWQNRSIDGKEQDLLSPRTWRKARHAHWVDPEWDKGWGLGYEVVHQGDRELIGHGGHMPGFFTSTYIDAKQKLGVIVLTNSMDAQPYLGNPRSIPERIFQWVGGAIAQPDTGKEKPTPVEWQRFEGTYRCIWCDVRVMVLDGQLVMVDPNEPNPKEALSTLEPIAGRPGQFRVGKTSDAQSYGESVVFEMEPGGRTAKSVMVGSARLERVASAWNKPAAN
ncbi:MAG: beta-lactamase family protein [Planctomycetaceae bacterium]|nr:beta-lactamase family protein [Planctomycetaceae bacterium]